MKVAVFVKATTSSEAGIMPSEQRLTAMGRYNEELVKAGILVDGAGLHPSAKAVRVRFSGADWMVINGPFAETKELVSGYWLWEVRSIEEAVAWLKQCPNPMPEDSEVEIRPLFTEEDFGAAFTPELRSLESRLRTESALRQATVQPYLFFGGRCDEALAFYKTALSARVGMVMRWSDCPEPPQAGTFPPGYEQKIMHCDFTVGNLTIFASDGCPSSAEEPSRFEGFRLTLTVPTAAVADHTFAALANGGRIDMPLTKTFWSPRYGMVTDLFGVGWMVMVPGQQP